MPQTDQARGWISDKKKRCGPKQVIGIIKKKKKKK